MLNKSQELQQQEQDIKRQRESFRNTLNQRIIEHRRKTPIGYTFREVYQITKNPNFTDQLDCLKTNIKRLTNHGDLISLSDFVEESKINRFCRINGASRESLEKVFLVILLSVIAKSQVNRFSPSVISEVVGISERVVSRCLNVLEDIKVVSFWGKAVPHQKARDARLNIPKKRAKFKLKKAFKKAKYEAVKFARKVQAGKKQVFKYVKVSKDYMSACYRAFKAIGNDRLTFSQRIGRSAFVLKKAIEEAGLGFDSDQIKRGLSIMFNKFGGYKGDVTRIITSIVDLLERLLDKGSEVV